MRRFNFIRLSALSILLSSAAISGVLAQSGNVGVNVGVGGTSAAVNAGTTNGNAPNSGTNSGNTNTNTNIDNSMINSGGSLTGGVNGPLSGGNTSGLPSGMTSGATGNMTSGANAGMTTGTTAGKATINANGTVNGTAVDGTPVGSVNSATSATWNAENQYWQNQYRTRPYYNDKDQYQLYEPAYRYGDSLYHRFNGRRYEDIDQTLLQREWEQNRGNSTLNWTQAQAASRDAYVRLHGNANINK